MSRYSVLSILLIVNLASCASGHRVSYQADIYPILEARCLVCHTPPQGEGYRKGRLDLTSYHALRDGSIYGPVIRPGDSRHSILNMLVEGRADSCIQMLHEQEGSLSLREIDMLRDWVNQGARDN